MQQKDGKFIGGKLTVQRDGQFTMVSAKKKSNKNFFGEVSSGDREEETHRQEEEYLRQK